DGVDAVVGQHQLLHLADVDAAVGDLTAGEDATGVGQVHRHGVVVVVEDRVEVGVARADERHAQQRDHREDDQLDLGTPGDHFDSPPTTIGGTSRLTSDGS